MKKRHFHKFNSYKLGLLTLAILTALSWSTTPKAATDVTTAPTSSNDYLLGVTLTAQLEAGDNGDRYGWIAKNGWVWQANMGQYWNVTGVHNFNATYQKVLYANSNATATTLIGGILANTDKTLEGSVELNLDSTVNIPQTIFYGVLGYTNGFISNDTGNTGHVNNQTFTIDGSLTLNISSSAMMESVYGISTGHPGTTTGVTNTLNVGGTVSINYSGDSDMSTLATNIIGAEVLQGGTITVGNVEINLPDVAPTGYVYGAIVSSDSTSNATLTLTNGVTVNITGTWNSSTLGSNFVPNSIYGVVNGSSNSSAFKLGASATNYRTLNLGTSSNSFTTTNETGIKVFSFSNFDKVNVPSGSTLILTVNNQTPTLYSDSSAFGSTTYDSGSSLLNGITSYAGRLLIRGATLNTGSSTTYDAGTLIINSGSTGNLIMELENSGSVVVNGDLTLTDTAITLNSSTYNSGFNAGTISGSGTLTFAPYISYSLTSGDTGYSSSIATKSDTFTNKSGGTITVSTMNISGASVTNAGTIGSGTQTLNVQSSASDYGTTYESQLTNSGTVGVANLNMKSGTVDNSYLLGAINYNQTGGLVKNQSNAYMGMASLDVTGGTIDSYGTIVGVNFKLENTGLVAIESGTFAVVDNVVYSDHGYTVQPSTSLSGGTLVVGNSSSSGSIVALNPSGEIYSKVYVYGGRLGLGSVKLIAQTSALTDVNNFITDALDYAQDALDDIGITSMPNNLLALTTPVTTSTNSYIGVGVQYSGSTTSSSGASTTDNNTGLYFGNDSYLIIRASLYGNDESVSAFTAASDPDVTVNGEAKLLVAVNLSNGEALQNRYLITKGYTYDTSALWQDNTSYIKVVDNFGQQWDYELGWSGSDSNAEVYLYKASDTPIVGVCDLGYVTCNNIKSDIDHLDDSNPGTLAVLGIIGGEGATIEQRVAVMNSIANLPFAGGVIGTGMNSLMGGLNDINNHLTMDSDTFAAHGIMWPYEEKNNFWLNITGTWANQRHLSASGINRAGWRDSSFGFILGYDRKLTDRPIAIGAAFSFASGNVKSTGNISYTKNSYQAYGAHLYANYSPNEHLNLIGALHYLRDNSDVTQKIGISGYNKAQGSMHTDWLAVGLRAETSFSAGKFTFIPHIEPRYVYAKLRNFDTKVDGATIWQTHAKGNSFFQIPVGIAARADFLTQSGLTVRPNLDVTVTPQVGSTRLNTRLTNIYNAADAVEGQFMGKFQAAVKVGVQIDKKNFTLGARYGVVAGDRGRIDHGFILQGRLRF